MERELIKEKLDFYKKTLTDLENVNVEEEVTKRIQPMLEEIRAQVISEIKADKLKCEHYISLLNELDYDISLTETNEVLNEEPQTVEIPTHEEVL